MAREASPAHVFTTYQIGFIWKYNSNSGHSSTTTMHESVYHQALVFSGTAGNDSTLNGVNQLLPKAYPNNAGLKKVD